MYRKITKDLEKWFLKKDRKPLIVDGARQIGKTYIIDEFCKTRAKNYIKFDFIQFPKTIADANIEDFDLLKENLQVKYNFHFDDEDTIVFFDEVQKCPYLIQNLKYLKITYPNAKIICSGSLLGISYKKMSISFPVGYVDTITMKQMDFQEYLYAIGDERYIPYIEEAYKSNKAINNSFHEELLRLYYRYLYLGGMPEVLKNYIENDKDLSKMDRNIIASIVLIYREDMVKYASSENEGIRIQRIYDYIVPQLSKENPKFQYAKIDEKDNKKINYLTPLDWLCSSNLVYKCNQVNCLEYPLKAYEDCNSYKLYMNDVGILSYKSLLNPMNIVMNGDFSFKGKLAENYVIAEFISNNVPVFYYSEKDKGSKSMEIDFLIQQNDQVVPIEVKANADAQSKSLKSYMIKFKPTYAIRISTKNFGFENNIKSVPLYAVFCIK